jgi:acetyltransferase-like isoleucine patch superfamily enzyme
VRQGKHARESLCNVTHLEDGGHVPTSIGRFVWIGAAAFGP